MLRSGHARHDNRTVTPSKAGCLESLWQRRGPGACALLPLAAVFGAAAALRRGWWRWCARPWRAAVPVVVVGNLTVGGAGKTPTVIALIAHLKRTGWRPAVISRGYGRRNPTQCLEAVPGSSPEDVGDEPLLIAQSTGVPLVVGARRSEAARLLLARHPGIDILVSDDGLQHYAMARDVEIAVFDERGGGNGWLLPAGPLREPLSRKTDLVLYNAPAPSTALAGYLAVRKLLGWMPLAEWAQGPIEQRIWRPFSSLAGLRLAAAAGTGYPQRFFDMLGAEGLMLDKTRPLPDHADGATYAQAFAGLNAQAILITEKDAVKCTGVGPGPASKADRLLESDDRQICVVGLGYAPEKAFYDRLDTLLGPLRHGAAPVIAP